jgi:RNA polymerase-binding transcription factor DksA
MLTDETATVTELKQIRERLSDLLRFLPSPDHRRRVLNILSMAVVRLEGGEVRACAECGTDFAIPPEKLAGRRRRDLPRRCSTCHSSHRHTQAQRALAID